MGSKGKLQVYVAMFFSVVFWGFSFVWSKQALRFYGPISLIFFRLVLSVAFLFFFGLLFRQLQRVERKDWKKILIVAFWEPFAYFIGENYGLTHVSSTTASVIIATIPLFSPIAAYYSHGERISKLNLLGILLSVFGVVLVVLKPNFGFKADMWGLIFLLWAVFSAVMYSVFVLDLSRKYNVYTIITYQNAFGALMFLPVFFIMDLKNFMSVGFVWQAWKPILMLAIFASSLAFMFFTYGIKYLGITRANIVANLIPLFTAFFSFLVLGERFTWFNILGIFVVIVGVVLSQLGSHEPVVNEW